MHLRFLILFAFFYGTVSKNRMNFCYWGTWSHWRTGSGSFRVNNIDPHICTHFTYAFLGVQNNGVIFYMDPWLDLNLGNIRSFVSLRNRNPRAKFLFSIGGYNAASENFSRIAANQALRTTFTNNVVEIVNRHDFDGFNLDWEYPNQRDTIFGHADRGNFVLLCQQLFSALKSIGKIFVIAVAATESSATLSYDIPRLHPVTDFILVMTYDFHGSWNRFTGIHSAMYAGPHDTTPLRREWNVFASINYWIRQGVPRNKIIVGLPSFGRSFTLSNSAQNGVNAPSSGAGVPGENSQESGLLSYMEICQRVFQRGWTQRREDTQRVPFAFNGNQWVGYDDLESINYKLNFIIRENLGGSMWWSLESEDFRNVCGLGSFPLISLAHLRMAG